jgi:NDP-sugar pyrophosphorylase family protein
MAQLTAVILAGGLGTRLRPVVGDRPKVLAEVGGRPFLAHLLDQLQGAGVERAVLCTGYRAEQVEAAFGARYGRLRLAYSRETVPLGTGGALRLALRQVRSDRFLALNGDSYFGADLAAFIDDCQERDAAAALVLAAVDETARYGRVEIDAAGQVLSFVEKGLTRGPGLINAGIYWLDRALLEKVPASRHVSLERDVFPTWIGRGFLGWLGEGPFVDIGTPSSYAEAERLLTEGALS